MNEKNIALIVVITIFALVSMRAKYLKRKMSSYNFSKASVILSLIAVTIGIGLMIWDAMRG